MTRQRLTIVDVTDRADGLHEILWTNGLTTLADDDQLRRLELRESWLRTPHGPYDVA